MQFTDSLGPLDLAAEACALALVSQVDLVAADLLATAEEQTAVVLFLESPPRQPQIKVAVFPGRSKMGLAATRARLTQIMNLLTLAPDLQEALLFLPQTRRGREMLTERSVRRLIRMNSWSHQRNAWTRIAAKTKG